MNRKQFLQALEAKVRAVTAGWPAWKHDVLKRAFRSANTQPRPPVVKPLNQDQEQSMGLWSDKKPSRIVKLTDEQAALLKRDRDTIDKIDDVLAELVVKAAEKQAEMLEIFWRSVRALAEVDEEKETLEINWVTKEIRITERD